MKSCFAIGIFALAISALAQDVYENDSVGVSVVGAPGWKFISDVQRIRIGIDPPENSGTQGIHSRKYV
jgi:hypothetical protein